MSEFPDWYRTSADAFASTLEELRLAVLSTWDEALIAASAKLTKSFSNECGSFADFIASADAPTSASVTDFKSLVTLAADRGFYDQIARTVLRVVEAYRDMVAATQQDIDSDPDGFDERDRIGVIVLWDRADAFAKCLHRR